MEVTDADRLLARGVPITLRGQALRLILDFEALEFLEEAFGGLDLFVDTLRDKGWAKGRVRNLRKAVTAGLLHTKPAGQDIVDFERDIRGMLDFKHFVDYLDALVMAVAEAFPEVTVEEAPKVNGSASSHGRASIGTRRSASTAQIANSGV